MIVEKSEEDLVKAGFKMVHARKLKQIVAKYRIVEQAGPEAQGTAEGTTNHAPALVMPSMTRRYPVTLDVPHRPLAQGG